MTATAIVALVTGLLITPATKNIDRRWVLMFFSVLQIISSLLVAFAPTLNVMLMGRLLLGIAIGGFWAMSTATAMRLVPAEHVPKALAVIFSSVSVATVVAAPLGSYLGSLIGWRNVFILCILPSMLALLWQLWVLPSMKPESSGSLATLFRVLRRPGMVGGMLATILIFSGHFAFFTYLRPFLETVGRASVERFPDPAGLWACQFCRDIDCRASAGAQPAAHAGAGAFRHGRAGAHDGGIWTSGDAGRAAGCAVGLCLRSGAGWLVNPACHNGA